MREGNSSFQGVGPVAKVRTFERPKKSDGTIIRIPDYFACNVFDLRAMQKRLASNDLEVMQKVMKFGGKIDAALAERVAAVAKEWAVEKGATHYCHWFQPQTGSTAEKHDAFLWFDKSGNPIERFTGRELLQSEPDASSFPSGGIRSTFEARGYTGWDASSPMFLMETENGKTLYIPSVFVSYHGEALDFKVPLLRANESLSLAATKTLHLLGQTNITGVTTSVGSEQEFFVVDKELAMKRPDLKLSGRAVFGRLAAKGQELEDHYFGSIPSRVQAFFNELEVELYKLGVPIKTRHNEVAPGQFELAPIFESSNIACDHNQLTMKVLHTVGSRHGFVILLHEKPFSGVNGSGKHVNWSMMDSSGRNVLDPGKSPHQNMIFLTFLAATLQGIYQNSDILRASIASAGNDHRLGANEAPPAIISAFLGSTLDRILNDLESGAVARSSAAEVLVELDLGHVQDLAKDNTDRNRTSPFAFTGNKFEFRAVGSSASVSYPVAILNAAVADGLNKLNGRIEARSAGKKLTDEDILEVIREIVRETKAIRFEGNGYSQEWCDEAKRRGLGNYPSTPSALVAYKDTSKTQFLKLTGVLNDEDVESRMTIQLERYMKQRLIEVRAAIEMAQTGILPAGMTYLQNLMQISKDGTALGISSPAQKMASEVGAMTSRLDAALSSLKINLEKVTSGDGLEHHKVATTSESIANNIMPIMEELREAADALEAVVPSQYWPYPTYTQMLFGLE